MYAANYIFSRGFFNAWLIIAIIWLWGSMFVAGFYPIISGRSQIYAIYKALTTKAQGPQDRNASGRAAAHAEGSTSESSFNDGHEKEPRAEGHPGTLLK